MKILSNNKYLFLIDKEAEIKEEDYYHWKVTNTVQINRLFEEDRRLGRKGPKGHVSKVIAYYPLTKEAKELEKLPLLPNPFENSFDITKWAKEEHKYNHRSIHELSFVLGCEVGYEKAQSKQFNLEDMVKAIEMAYSKGLAKPNSGRLSDIPKVQEEIIQSLSTQQLPKEFIMGKGETIEEKIKTGEYIW